ncbi:hypothetical protein LB542_19635 [Mesorhizobium sp. BR1-1-9]|uniref:hypothetical protein n=1 Tax=Mesorhizobium sp. BR1-1-9 TaxID=2876646 RepID=UPI001CD14CB3|nr:hypothetical protein [Mesorhizobium sp. BR1-1-9]MBZ9873062.1 hypothetical protein [Mesorhizobium sp. BR1-1-9]
MGASKWPFGYIDLLLSLTSLLFSMLFFVLLSVNPKAKTAEDSTKPPGQMMVCIYWQGHNDVDLWFRPPGQDKATGYSNKSDVVADLVRDDLGTDNVPHFECQFARSLPDGRFVANIHGYAITEPEVTVHAEIRISGANGFELLLQRDLTLKQKQERTIAQFRLVDGEVVPGSENEVYEPLRSAK